MLHNLLILLLITLPFERVLTFDFLGFTIKPPYIAAIMLIIFGLFNYKKIDFKLSRPEVFFGLFVLLSFLTLFWSISAKYTSLISLMLLFMWLIMFTTKRLVCEQKERYLNVFIWLGLATSLFGLFQFFGDMFGLSQRLTLLGDDYIKGVFPFPRIQSTFFEPGFFANFLLLPIFILINRIITNKTDKFTVPILILILGTFFLTMSRGGIIALALSLVLYFIFYLVKNPTKIKAVAKVIILSVISLCFSLVLLFSVAGNSGIKSYFNQLINANDAVSLTAENKELVTRSYTIDVALKSFLDKPFGIGSGAFGTLPEFEEIRKEGNQRQTVNSLYPEILAEQGFIGLLLFALFVLFAIFHFIKNYLAQNALSSLAYAATIFAIFLQYISFSTLYLVYIWVFLGIVLLLKDNDAKQISAN